jgi:iron complex outermembrane receptor protein
MRSKSFVCCFFLLTPLLSGAQKDSAADVAGLLGLSLEQLMDIKVVTASGFLQTTSEAPSTITVITAKQIEERGYEQLEDALRDVPGIDMIHINGYAPTLIYFRGMYGAENTRALLMIDGIVENNILGSNDLAGPVYSLHNAERVEIIWGPVSALYGANAFGGVINIITKKGAGMDGLHFQQGFGSFNTSFQKLDMGTRKGNWEFAVAGTLYSSDGPVFKNRDPLYSGSYVDKAYSFNATASYYAKKSKTTIGYRVFRTPMGWGTYANSPTTYLRLPSQGNNNGGTIGIIQREIRGEKSGKIDSYLRTWFIQNEFKPNERLSFIGRFTYRETGQGEGSYIYVTTDGRKLYRGLIASYSNRVAGEFSANYSPSEMHRFSAGLQYYQDNVEAGARTTTFDLSTIYLIDGRDTVLNLNSTFLKRQFDLRNNFGSYFQYVLATHLLKKTDFTFGARYDYNSYFGNAFSPRITAVNQLNKKLSFKLQFGTAFRSPTNLEIHQPPPTGSFKLKKEKLITYEVNAIYVPSKKLRLQLNGFHNDLTDVIILGNLPTTTPDKNPAIIHITGVEGIVDWMVSKNISGFINFTWQDPWGKNIITGNSGSTPGVARWKGNAGITCHINDFLVFTVSGNYVGNRSVPRTNPYGTVKGYFLANCNISTVKLFKEKITASLNIHNFFNTKWLDPGFRNADGNLYSTVLEQPGINGLFKIGISL